MATARRPKSAPDKVRLRSGSNNFYVRLQYPKALKSYFKFKDKEFSLGTACKIQARILARPYIEEFDLEVAAFKSILTGDEVRHFTYHELKYPVGQTVLEDGRCVVASRTHYTVVAPGLEPETFPNVQIKKSHDRWSLAMERYLRVSPTGARTVLPADVVSPWAAELNAPTPAKAKPKKGDDGAVLIQHWIEDNGIKEPIQDEAWRTWNLFQELNGGKRLSEITREDATKLRHHMLDVMGLATGTVAKNCGHLRAAFKLAAAEHGYKGENPFLSLVSKKLIRNRGDSIAGEPYSEAEMAIVRKDLDNWREDARLLWVLCATTGMRPGEAFLINGEVIDCDIRCIDLLPRGRNQSIKTKGSQRRLPIPVAALPFLPARIEGRLFKRSESAVMHWLNRRLDKLGLIAEAKSLKSLRHRAVNRLNNVTDKKGLNAPPKLPEQICGHALEGVHNKVYYKKQHPIKVVKKWIDLIGY